LVNNAGIGGGAETEVIIDTNFKGPKRVTDALVGLIDKSGGRIVNVSSGLRISTKT
jgi:NAD(P)-dependent dehydrogenase (short-subunit alcohol dehydrogenase family)